MPNKEKKHRRGKIYPNADDEGATDNNSLVNSEAEIVEEMDNKTKSLQIQKKYKTVAKMASLKENALKYITNAKAGASRWKKYVTTKRQMSVTSGDAGVLDRRRTGGMGLEYDLAAEAEKLNKTTDKMDGQRDVHMQMIATHNRNLIEYFARLGQSRDADVCVNLEYLLSIIKAGGNIDCTDKYGQTIFHEVARAWHVDIAKFLVEHKADVNKADNYGRTPLHVAAAVDYPEMVNFLISKGATKEALTKGEHQTPVHFAARNDACLSLKALLKHGCLYKDVRDFKGRTPLHVAAELDRSETARLLLELDDPAPAGVEDQSGQAAITWMIAKMPPVAKLALDQFHTTDRANRRQAYHLHRLEPRRPNDSRDGFPQSPMQVIVRFRRFDLIEHPCFMQLIKLKWKRYGRQGALISMFINFLFIIFWTLQGVLIGYDTRYHYILPSQWWRIVLFICALLFTAWQLKDELSEYINSKKMHTKWKNWREGEIEKDLKYTHPRWPEEERYLKGEQEELDKQKPQYFNDFWNIFDWVCYGLLLVVIVTHLADVIHHVNALARANIRIMSVTIILIWIRLLKNARAFSYLGPFIVMLTHMLSDVLRFILLYLEFFIPFCCAFWMLFGGEQTPDMYQGSPSAANYTVTVTGMATFEELMFSLFRMTLVDEYDYSGMRTIDPIMSYILIGAWLGLSAILMLNLFIALMSDTFQRVYDNAQANAIMQKAITILGIEEGLNQKKREKFRGFIHEKCAPREEEYDDDEAKPESETLQKVTIQIKRQLEEMQENFQVHDKEKLWNSDDDDDEQLDEMESKLHNGDYHSGGHRKRTISGASNLSSSFNKVNDGALSEVTFNVELSSLKSDIEEIRKSQKSLLNRYKQDMVTVKDLLTQIAANQSTVMRPGDMAPRRTSTLSRVTAVQPVEGPPPLYSSHPSVVSPATTSRPPLHSRSYSMRSRPADHDMELMEQHREDELRQLRQDLAHRASLQHNIMMRPAVDDQNSNDGVLSGSQLVVEVSDHRISGPAQPPPYRSDSDAYHSSATRPTSGPRDETNC